MRVSHVVEDRPRHVRRQFNGRAARPSVQGGKIARARRACSAIALRSWWVSRSASRWHMALTSPSRPVAPA